MFDQSLSPSVPYQKLKTKDEQYSKQTVDSKKPMMNTDKDDEDDDLLLEEIEISVSEEGSDDELSTEEDLLVTKVLWVMLKL